MTTEWEQSVLEPIDTLLARWQERGDSETLAMLLPGWRGNNGLTDGWADVVEALRSTSDRAEIPYDEAATLAAVADRIQSAIDNR